MEKKIFNISVLLIVLAGLTYSQENLNLNLQESIRIGIRKSYTLHQSKMSVKLAEAKLSETKTFKLPVLDFNASYTRLSEVKPFTTVTPFGIFRLSPAFFNVYNFRLSLRQPLFTGFKLENTTNIAKFNSLAARQSYTNEEKNLILNIKQTYWNLFKAKKIEKIINENVQQINSHLQDVKNLLDQGLATNNDFLKVKVQLAEIKLKQIEAKNSIKLAEVSLNNILVLPLTTKINITEKPVGATTKLKSLEKYIEDAITNRADLKALKFKINASDKNIDLAKSGWFPQIYLTSNYYYSNPNRRILPSVNQFKGTWDIGLALSFNLWNWGATSDRKVQAKMQYEQAKDYYASLQDVIKLQVTQSYLNVQKSLAKMKLTKQSVFEATENYRVTENKFKNGLVINSDLLDAEVSLLQSKINKIQAIVDYNLSLAVLQRSIGN